MADDCEGRAGQNKHRWNPEAEKPFVRTAEGKGRFLNVTCLCKSNFATLNSYHSGNATKRSRGYIISRLFVAIIVFDSKHLHRTI